MCTAADEHHSESTRPESTTVTNVVGPAHDESQRCECGLMMKVLFNQAVCAECDRAVTAEDSAKCDDALSEGRIFASISSKSQIYEVLAAAWQ